MTQTRTDPAATPDAGPDTTTPRPEGTRPDAWAQGFTAGWDRALEAVAVDLAELDALGDGWRELAAVTAQGRIAERVAEMESFDVEAWYVDNAERQRRHDEARARERPRDPATSWRRVHAEVSPEVWARVWGDLADATRLDLLDLDPAMRPWWGATP